jgi:hypothetical protein
MHRPDSRTVKAILALAAIACLTATPATAALVNLTPAVGFTNSATSVTLDSLLTGADMGIVVGDKIFTGFSYSRVGDMPLATNVNVLGFRDNDGNWGVTFNGAFADLPGGGSSDALIRFMVEVANATTAPFRISDAHLFIGGVGVGDESFFTVDESFLGRNETLNAFVSTIGPGPQQQQLSDMTLITPNTTKLTVTKDIFALAADGGFLPARATVIDQSFSQIPEPMTMVLAGLSGLGLVSIGRRRG